MGVNKLTKILSDHAPKALVNVSSSHFSNQVIAIDASCHLNKFIYGDEQVPHRHIYGFYQLARFCDMNHIKPIFVFDGPHRVKAKHLEHAKRARVRHKVKHSLAFEQEQALRLEAWLDLTDKDNLTLLNEEKKVLMTRELQLAVETAQDTEKYTKTVRALAEREGGVVTDLDLQQLNYARAALLELKKENQHMVGSLEKRSFSITQGLRTECQDFLTTLGYVCFTCNHHEAEAMCATLAKHGRTTATVSEDLDTLVFGDVPLLRHFFSRGRPILSIDPIIARKSLGLSRESFIDLCILCGTDFSGTIQGIGPTRALQWIQKYKTIENVLDNIHDTPYKPRETFDYQLARHVFNDLPPIPMHDSAYEPPFTVQAEIKDILEHYQINPDEVDQKLQTTVLAQTIVNTNAWGSDPFANTISLSQLQLNS